MKDPRPQDTATDVLVRIRQELPLLSRAEARVARTIVDNPGAAVNETITALATRSGASQASVVRFCRHLGYDGYAEFRIGLAQATSRQEAELERSGLTAGDIDPTDGVAEVVARLAYQEARSIEDTARTVSLTELERAVAAVDHADHVLAVGYGASAVTAQDLAQKLVRIGLPCVAPADFHLQLVSASLASSRTVAVVVSYGGATAEAIEVATLAKGKGATVIVITNVPNSPLAGLADIVLATAASESRFRAGALASRIAQLAVVDFLFVRLVQARFDDAQAALATTREALQAHR
ncbi:MAG: MurR/RpiR family transcriptional regulator [Propionibacteriaceae bacterium]|jgi:DNA-binding MurR/RpiR family transcriptional regulator|nr:MurR/RpiR family transcriptional regulator [Propionibacteriaceae bacterium]